MRACQKQIKFLLLFSLSIFFLAPFQVFADEKEPEKGKMEIKTDRILKSLDDEGEIVETELDRTFPGLFDAETKEKIDDKQEKNEEVIKGVKSHIFLEEMPETTSLYDVQSELFTEDYQSPNVFAGEPVDEQSTNFSSLVVYGSLVTFIGIIGGGVIMLFRKFEL